MFKCWVLIYAGMPDLMLCDHGLEFISQTWKELSEENGFVLKYCGVQHHISIGVCKRYHGPLRKIFLKILDECPDMSEDLILQFAVKAMNDTISPERMVPSLLVYGITPTYSPTGLDAELPNYRQRHQAISISREEYLRITNNLRVRHSLSSKVPECADIFYKKDDMVWIYRDEIKRYVGTDESL